MSRALVIKASLALACLATLGGLFALLLVARSGMSSAEVTQWLAGFALALGVQGVILFRFLPRNRQQCCPEMVSSEFGAANYMTIFRAGLNSACFAFACVRPAVGWQVFPFALYVGSIVLDFFDGYVARITGRSSAMGEALEHEFDSIGVIAATSVAWSWGALPLVYLIAAPARTIYLVAEYVRRARGRAIYPLTYTISSRVIAGLYMGFLCVALIPGFPILLLRSGGPLFLLPLAGGFLRDWMVATGTLTPHGRLFRTLRTVIVSFATGRLPVVLRVLAAAMLVILAVQGTNAAATAALGIGAMAIVAGLAARGAGLVMLGVLAFHVYPYTGPEAVTVSAFMLCTAILVLGSGYFSLAKPEELPFARRIG